MFLKNFLKLNFGMFLFLFPDHVLEDGWRTCLDFENQKWQSEFMVLIPRVQSNPYNEKVAVSMRLLKGAAEKIGGRRHKNS
jgi:hypothetical protein